MTNTEPVPVVCVVCSNVPNDTAVPVICGPCGEKGYRWVYNGSTPKAELQAVTDGAVIYSINTMGSFGPSAQSIEEAVQKAVDAGFRASVSKLEQELAEMTKRRDEMVNLSSAQEEKFRTVLRIAEQIVVGDDKGTPHISFRDQAALLKFIDAAKAKGLIR